MDLDPHYCAVAIERWQNWTGQQATLASNSQPYADVMRERAKAEAELTAAAGLSQ